MLLLEFMLSSHTGIYSFTPVTGDHRIARWEMLGYSCISVCTGARLEVESACRFQLSLPLSIVHVCAQCMYWCVLAVCIGNTHRPCACCQGWEEGDILLTSLLPHIPSIITTTLCSMKMYKYLDSAYMGVEGYW